MKTTGVLHAVKKLLPVIISVIIVTCSIVHRTPEINSYTEQCQHCHGDRLQGNRNPSKACAECHELTPIAPSEVQSQKIKDAITSEPHIHTTKNLFSGTPSCFNCHRPGTI